MDSLLITPLIDPNAAPSDPARAVDRNKEQNEAYKKLLDQKNRATETGA